MALDALILLAFLALEMAAGIGELAEILKKDKDITTTDGAAFISPYPS